MNHKGLTKPFMMISKKRKPFGLHRLKKKKSALNGLSYIILFLSSLRVNVIWLTTCIVAAAYKAARSVN